MAKILYPTQLTEAVQLLRRPGKSAFLAGGTTLTPEQRDKLDVVVGLRDLKLDYIRSDASSLHIGALMPLQALIEAGECRGALASALQDVASPDLKLATMGGTLVTADASNPLAVVLLVLDAVLTVYTPEARQLPLDSFINYRERLTQDGALITQVSLPLRRLIARAAYVKIVGASGGAPLICASASARPGIGKFTDARVAVGGVAPTAVRLLQVEQWLEGKPLTDELIEQAGELAASSAVQTGSSEHHRESVRQLVRQMLCALR